MVADMRLIIRFPLKRPFRKMKSNFKDIFLKKPFEVPKVSLKTKTTIFGVPKVSLKNENYNLNTIKFYAFSFSYQ